MFFANRIYGIKVLRRIEQLLLEYLGPTDGAEAVGGLFGIMELLERLGRLDATAHLKQLRKSGLTIDDAAVSIIDGTVPSLRALANESGQKEAAETLIPLFERALDKHMTVRPGLFVPRNGIFGRAATEHLSEWFKR